MDPSTSKIRLAALVATVVALLAISIPFVWQHDEPAADGAPPSASADAGLAPAVSHDADAGPMGDEMEDNGTGACMADAKAANLDFTLPNLEGQQVKLSDYKGKVILLNFWATWCGPCKAEIPSFVELQNEHKDGLVVVGFSVDDTADKAKAFATEYKVNYPMLLGLGHEDVQDAYGPLWGIPASFLISRDGKVCKKHLGIAPKSVFKKEIEALL